jgi:4-azaleucine resistance transporter AzlC
MPSKKHHFFQGIKSGGPIAIGYMPIAIAFGALALKSNMTVSETVAMSVFVFAGASQFMAASMLLTGAGAAQIILATFFVNLRHLIMSMAVSDKLKGASKLQKTGLAFGITDETFALITLQGGIEENPISPVYTAGVMIEAYLSWVTGTTIGALGAQVIPPSVSSGMTVGLYALFIGLLVPHMRKSIKISIIAIASMLLNSLFNSVLDPGWAIVLATVLAAILGVFILKKPS